SVLRPGFARVRGGHLRRCPRFFRTSGAGSAVRNRPSSLISLRFHAILAVGGHLESPRAKVHAREAKARADRYRRAGLRVVRRVGDELRGTEYFARRRRDRHRKPGIRAAALPPGDGEGRFRLRVRDCVDPAKTHRRRLYCNAASVIRPEREELTRFFTRTGTSLE